MSFASKFKDPSKAREERVESAEKMKKMSQGNNVFLVTGKEGGKDVWHYVLVDKLKMPMFQRQVKTDFIDLNDYGHLLHSGWGAEAPQEIKDKMKEEYSV